MFIVNYCFIYFTTLCSILEQINALVITIICGHVRMDNLVNEMQKVDIVHMYVCMRMYVCMYVYRYVCMRPKEVLHSTILYS
jgi:hypothetical protein